MIAVLALLFLALAVIINYSKQTQTGYAILGIETTYLPNETLKGNILLSLKPGELIPKDSIVSIKIKDEEHSYPISQLISESTNSGDYYIEDKSISGSGEGYGKIGERKVYPEVTFTLKISKDNSEENTNSDSEEQTGPIPENSENNSSANEQENQEAVITPIEETPAIEPAEETPAIEPAPQKLTTPQTDSSVPQESTSSETTDTSPQSEPSSSLITGAVTSKIDLEVQGTVSKNNPYTYKLKNKQTAEITSSSQPITLDIKEDSATVTTDYYETEMGFGSNYLTNSPKYEIKIDLTQLNIMPEDGDIIVSIIWENTSIAEVATNLNINEQNRTVMPEENTTNQTAANQTTINQTIIMPYDQIENVSSYALTEQEKLLLQEKAGISVAEIKSAQEKNGKAIVKLTLGSYWLEKSYEYPNPNIESQI